MTEPYQNRWAAAFCPVGPSLLRVLAPLPDTRYLSTTALAQFHGVP